MLVTVTILAVALIPTGDSWWLTEVFLVSELGNIKGGDFQVNTIGVPAICYFKKLDPSNSRGAYKAGQIVISSHSFYQAVVENEAGYRH